VHTQAYDLSPDVFRRGDHDEVFSRLRVEDPVHWYDDGDSHPFWCLTKHSDVQMANRDVDTFTVTGGFTLIDSDVDPLRGGMMGEMLPGMGPHRHTRYRRIVNRGFTPRTLRLLEDHLAFKAQLIVDGVAGRDDFEFVDNVASLLPLQAICELVGIPEDDRNKIVEWSKVMTGIDDPNVSDQEAGMIASAEMIAYADELRIERLSMPREDIITKLTNAQVGEEALSESEFGMFFILLVVAGNETTRNATAHGMRALLEHPDQLRLLQGDPSQQRMERAVEEILRWSSPVQYFRRTATRDIELRGKRIREGDWVVLWYASANRDEDAFSNPFTFDVTRWPNDHVTFGGGGPHFCLGANLARLELRLIFTEMLTRLPELELAGEVEILRSNFVRGVMTMSVRRRIAV
jgi:cholest-4-en-3-one 26-monooxygenase